MEHQYLEDDYLYEDEDALSQLRELRSKIDYARKNGDIEKALFLYMDYVECDVFRLYCKNAIRILPEFMELPPFERGKSIIKRHKDILQLYEIPDSRELMDVDCIEDLDKIQGFHV